MGSSARMLAAFRQEMERVRQARLTRNLPDPAQGLGGLLGAIPEAVKASANLRDVMRVPHQISAQSSELADSIRKSMLAGTDPFAKFQRQSDLLQEGLTGGSWLGSLFGKSVLKPDQFQFGLLGAFRELRESVSSRLEVKLPATAYRGSVEAQEVINRSMAKSQSLEEEMVRILREAQRMQQEQRDLEKRQAETLDKILKRPVFRVGKV